MSTLQIEERITVSAPPGRVWKFLLDPARVAACLPGAKLDGTEGEDTFLGTMKIKVGPVLMEIKGKATMSHIDPVARKVTLTGTGNDKAGGGSARMDMKSEILEKEGGGSEILVHAEVHLAGKLVRFGRGMMEGISKQLFKQFAERVHGALDEDDDEEEEEREENEGGPPPAEREAETAPPDKAPLVAADSQSAKADEAPPTEVSAKAKELPAPEAGAVPAEAEDAPPAKAETALPARAEASKTEETPAARSESTTDDKAPSPSVGAELVKDDKAPSVGAEIVKDDKAPSATAELVKDDKAPPTAAETPEAAASKPNGDAPDNAPPTKASATTDEAAAPAKEAPPASTALAPVRKKKTTKKPVVAPADNAPLDAGSLVWAANWAWFRGIFGRIFGRND